MRKPFEATQKLVALDAETLAQKFESGVKAPQFMDRRGRSGGLQKPGRTRDHRASRRGGHGLIGTVGYFVSIRCAVPTMTPIPKLTSWPLQLQPVPTGVQVEPVAVASGHVAPPELSAILHTLAQPAACAIWLRPCCARNIEADDFVLSARA